MGSGGGAATAKETPPQAARGQARKAENAARKAERQAAREAADLNPAWTCKAELEGMGDEAFAEEYGANDNAANAFGKCVSLEAQERDGVASEDEEASPQLESEAPASVEAMALIRTVLHAMRGLL